MSRGLAVRVAVLLWLVQLALLPGGAAAVVTGGVV